MFVDICTATNIILHYRVSVILNYLFAFFANYNDTEYKMFAQPIDRQQSYIFPSNNRYQQHITVNCIRYKEQFLRIHFSGHAYRENSIRKVCMFVCVIVCLCQFGCMCVCVFVCVCLLKRAFCGFAYNNNTKRRKLDVPKSYLEQGQGQISKHFLTFVKGIE